MKEKSTIALVDDERNILTSLRMALEAEGYKVRTYGDGVSALEALTEEPADLGIFDIKMPRMDGMELLRRLQAQYAPLLEARYRLNLAPDAVAEMPDDELLAAIGRKRGAVMSGGRVNLQKASEIVLTDFRSAVLGRITPVSYTHLTLPASDLV